MSIEEVNEMSLNQQQRKLTSEELKAHFEQSTLSEADLAHALNITKEEVVNVLNMDAPSDLFGAQLQRFIHLVWDVRDEINQNIRLNGKEPEPYTYLKGEKEDYWFLR